MWISADVSIRSIFSGYMIGIQDHLKPSPRKDATPGWAAVKNIAKGKKTMGTEMKTALGKETYRLLEWLGQYGKDPEGGISRLLYSSAWRQAQKALEQLFGESGLEVHYDEIGNLFGKLAGSKYPNETILSGSHIDTVKNGGLYDGQFGIIAAFLAITRLKETYGPPLRNIEVVSLAEEEGSRFPFSFWGSKNLVGTADDRSMREIKDFDGVSFVESMHSSGFDFKTSRHIRPDLKAFIELHVEQGGVLEIEKIPIGIVDHIVGERRYTVEVAGEANHAGTTPMKYRKDAMSAASRMIHEINDLAAESGDPLVATVGKVNVEPNIANVIPGKVTFTLDVRHTEEDALQEFSDELTDHIRQLAAANGVDIRIDMWMDEEPVKLDPRIVKAIQKQCDDNRIPYKFMHSGAGHDTQIIAPHIPAAMLFVPSRNGISHSPHEYTAPEDLAEGVNVLTHTLYELAYRHEGISS